MAKVKVVKNNLDENLNGTNFVNTASQTVFKFGNFNVTSNFNGRELIDYSKELSTFVRPVTLETLVLTDTESDSVLEKTKNVTLNLDRSDLNTFAKFGSAYEFLKVSIQNIIINYPGSLFVDSQIERYSNTTFYDYTYDNVKNISTFKIPSEYTVNKFGLIYNLGNQSIVDDNVLKNINISYTSYVVWSENFNDNSHIIVGFTGDTIGMNYLTVKCLGNAFPTITGGTTSGSFNFHLKPNTRVFEDFRIKIRDYEKYIVSNRDGVNGFNFTLKDPTLLDDGSVNYVKRNILWNTGDGYNVDIDSQDYRSLLESVLSIGGKYDQIKTDLIARFLTPTALQTYDLTDNKKTSKLLRIYGAEFDQMKTFIDSLVYINKVTYDKKKNLPDQVVSNLARTFGWEYFQLVKEDELVDRLLETAEPERKLDEDLTPAEVDIEMWRRILINTNYFWKSKGTREAIKAMFMLIGIPEPFINITEYIYTVEGQIDPRQVPLTLDDLPSASLPYDESGYPIAPIETSDFYYQVSGDSDGGQQYMNNFRNVGFNLSTQVDNKKSWVQTGSTYRRHYSSPTYYQQDNKLVLNTKEVDISLDTARGIEYDVYNYNKDDFEINSTGYTMPYSFINLSLNVTGTTQNQFQLPTSHEGDYEVRFNGILLNSDKKYTTSGGTSTGNTENDYTIVGENLTLLGGSAKNSTTGRDVVQVTYLFSGVTTAPLTGLTVTYIVARVIPNATGTEVMLPEIPAGDVQLTINGVAATKGTPQFIADYIIDPNNPQKLIIQNPALISYFAVNPYTQIAMIHANQNNIVNARSEVTRVDSLQSGKVYFNNNANKTVYKLNYKVNDVKAVKILVNGIGLEPGVDYTVNPNNKYELFLPPGINFGTVISAYYLVGDSAAFTPSIDSDFGVGDISNLSFLEFTELVQRKMINATNRKVITDHKGGWYPTLLKIYTTYLSRENLESQDPLKSNGYTFENLYPFLNKYNAFFNKFVNELLSSTIIQRKGGLLIRNTVFTKQKFPYKRGVSFDASLNYFGDDGATYLKKPLFQRTDWTTDELILPNKCNDFIVDGIAISYPSTTTTTTKQLLNTVLYYENVFTSVGPIENNGESGTESTEKYNIVFDPGIIPGYLVKLRLNFLAKGIVDANDIETRVFASVIVKVNNIIMFSYDELLYDYTPTEITLFDKSYDLTISNSDVVEVALYNHEIRSVVSPEQTLSSTQLSAVALSVTPDGSVGGYIPSSVENKVRFNLA